MRDLRAAAMTAPAHILRTAWRALLQHAGNVARSSGREAIGWLLGFYVGDEAYVLDAHPATRYKHQSRYGATADPAEEAEIAVRYPRNVGIVGLYHSHPFKDDTRHAIFHSATDDTTLKSRAARRENFVSVVTDGRSAECFVFREGFPAPVTPAIEESLSVAGHLKRYTTSVAPSISLAVSTHVSYLRLAMITSAPQCAAAKAISRPRPRLPPVTSTTRSVTSKSSSA